MVRRFQIEDLLDQDGSGVVFRALDTETGQHVAVRRFFPFGVGGGGLSAEKQADYSLAVGRLSGIAHPALRSIICGGCDPVDGMPFIAIEWVEGTPLQSFVECGPLSPADATQLLDQALEVCELISSVLGEEDVWVETDFHAIIVGDEASGRGTTFSISPLRWLGERDGPRGLDAIASLTESIMGWQGKDVLDHAGGGLGGWLKRLREANPKITLSAARELLAGVGRATPATAVKRPVIQAVHGRGLKTPKRKSGLRFVIFGTIALAAICLGGWALIHQNNVRLNAAAGAVVEEEPDKELVTAAPTEPPPGGQQPMTPKPVFKIEDSAKLLKMKDQEVTFVGVLKDFKQSKNRKNLYLVFSENSPLGEACGAVSLGGAPADLSKEKLTPLKNKKIQLNGRIRINSISKTSTPVISITTRAAIREVP